MKHIKSKYINRITNETLSHLLRVSSSKIEVDFDTMSLEAVHAQNSH